MQAIRSLARAESVQRDVIGTRETSFAHAQESVDVARVEREPEFECTVRTPHPAPNTSAAYSLSNLKLVADRMLLNDFFISGLSFSDASGRQVGRRRRNRARTSTWVCCCAAFPLDRQVCNGSSSPHTRLTSNAGRSCGTWRRASVCFYKMASRSGRSSLLGSARVRIDRTACACEL